MQGVKNGIKRGKIMKKTIVLLIAIILLFAGCKKKSSPTSPAADNTAYTATATPTVHASATATPTYYSSATATRTRTFTPTIQGSSTDTRTITPTFTATASPTDVTCANPGFFGLDSAGTSVSFWMKNFVTRYTLFEEAYIYSLNVYTAGTGNIQAAIYSDNSGSPYQLIASSSVTPGSSGWVSMAVTAHLMPGIYWLAAQTDGPTNSLVIYGRDTTGEPINTYGMAENFGTFPSTFTAQIPEEFLVDVYASYCRPPGAPTLTPTPMSTSTDTITVSPTFTVADTDTVTQTATESPVASATPTFTATITFTPGSTPVTCASPGYFGQDQPYTDLSFWTNISASKFTLTEEAYVNTIWIFVNNSGNVQAGIYTDNSGSPGDLIASSAVQPVSQGSANGWAQVPMTDIRLVPGDYWIAIQTDGPAHPISMWGKASAGSVIYYADENFGVMPSSYTVTNSTGGYEVDAYAGYCKVTP
jgi:hypothetical protein